MIGKELGDGRFKIIGAEPLGRGGFATVHLGLQVQLNRKVAIKILSATAAEDAELVHRFIREARVVAMFEHPNIIRVIDSGSEAGLNYFVMTYLHGTLQQRLNEPANQNGLPLDRWLKIAKQISSALDYIHSHRTIKEFVHRDIKPGNIMFDESGNAILTDFGLVKGDQFSQLTLKDTVMGTPKYMSPEQVRGLQLDHRSDLYSFGIVLYEMLLGRPPFSGEPLTICHKQITETPPQPHSIKPDIPAPVENIILKLIEKDPAKRFQSARELYAELEEWENMTYRSQPTANWQSPSRTMPVPETADNSMPDATPTVLQPIKTEPDRASKSAPAPRVRNTNSKALYFLGGLFLLLCLALGLYLTHPPETPVGWVTFQSKPEAAAIFVNNELLPHPTPWTQIFPAGDSLQIRFEFAGLSSIFKSLVVNANDTHRVVAEFDTLPRTNLAQLPEPGKLRIQSTPPGATIFVDGQKLAHQTPFTWGEIIPGNKKITLRKSGFLDYTENLEIEPAREHVLNATLVLKTSPQPEYGKLNIASNVWGTIWIKGETGDFGQTNTVLELPARPQPYQITVERVGYQTKEGYREVIVQPGTQTELTFTLIDTSAHH
jgi:serine/threonine protein kinase